MSEKSVELSSAFTHVRPSLVSTKFTVFHCSPSITLRYQWQDTSFGGTLMVGLITEPLGFAQDAQDVMVLFDEWLAVLGLCSVGLLDDLTAGRRLYVMTA